MSLFWILRIVRLGIKNLLLHKLRSLLNMLGILFGVGSVIAMLAIGEGAKWEAQEMVKRLGPTTILLTSEKPVEAEESSTSTSRMVEYGLTFLDMDRIAETLPGVKVVVPVRKVSKEIWMRGIKHEANLFGTIPRYAGVTSMRVAQGRWLCHLDFAHSRPVCVLTYQMARELFPARSALGATLQFGDAAFTVVGVLEQRRGGSRKGRSSADEPMGAYTPFTALRERFGDINVKADARGRSTSRAWRSTRRRSRPGTSRTSSRWPTTSAPCWRRTTRTRTTGSSCPWKSSSSRNGRPRSGPSCWPAWPESACSWAASAS